QGLAAGTLRESPQDQMDAGNGPLKHAPKIFTDTCKIDWYKPVDTIYNLIRGLSPYPAAFTQLNGKQLKIFRATRKHETSTKEPGTHETDGKSYLRFVAKDGYVYVTELQLEGKKKMKVEDFLRGFRD
ncbi:MAG TPA: methionyl-tRNA formyltransferase, partial [Chitinophagaceae bacterium]|nr:methionyl-tRNA formyltransferase [Chitinophagaceae bacterium]